MTAQPADLVAGTRRWWIAAAGGGGLALAAGLVLQPADAWPALLVSAFYFITIALGSLVLLAMLTVANAGWHANLKRVFEALAAYLPAGAVTFVILLAGVRSLYHWAHPGAAAHDAVLHAKAGWLNVPFFAVRTIAVVMLWNIFAALLRRNSLQQDADGELRRTRQDVLLSALLLVCFPLSFSLASFDWLMSLEPHWASTMFGFYNIAGLLVAALAAAIVTIIVLRRRDSLTKVSANHLHDLGKLLFGLSTVWAYLWFSQYLLVWYTNMPEETAYYLARTRGGWAMLFWANVVIGWVVPFVVLLARGPKRSERALLAVSVVVLAGRWLDVQLMVGPAVRPDGPGVGPLDVAAFLGLGAVFVLVIDRALAAAPLLRRADPYLVEGLHH